MYVDKVLGRFIDSYLLDYITHKYKGISDANSFIKHTESY